MNAFTQVCVFMFLLLLISTPTLSKTLPYPFRIETHTYPVHGDTILSFYDNVAEAARLQGFTDRYAEVHYEYNFYYSGECDANLINLSIKITYPILDLTKTDESVVPMASSYVERLKQHELAHCTITIKNFTDAYNHMLKGQNGNCLDANNLAESSLDLLDEEHEDLDVITNRGTALIDNKQFIHEEYLPFCLGM